MEFLHELFNNPIAKKALSQVTVLNGIADNLKFRIRPYQEEAFRRYLYTEQENFEGKPGKPLHLLYNMATGSGKTMVMAGLMLHLYAKGYRNFLFFVNSNTIIQKTKDNFLSPQTSKYLFREKIVIDGKEILIKPVDNFDESDGENINIKFTTIQQLHTDLSNTRENSITFEDFKSKEMVLIADEAHHLNSGTKSGHLFGSWEETVLRILHQNFSNILLEFTATLDYESRQIADKYKDKVIYKYDLARFRTDKFSKEINLVRSMYDERDRIIQALILNLYRQELAAFHHINLKPVILFKAKRTIRESEANKENFHSLIRDFSEAMVEQIRKTSTVPVVQKAFQFFGKQGISQKDIACRIQSNFREENCLSANNDAEAEKNQILLNTLEDEKNPVRAVFAVQKLNEGWDVLNLFDIVRLYEDRDGKDGKPGKTTLSEAQLIGRGARYFPFAIKEGDEMYLRKYDDDLSNDIRVLEELYYHTKEDSRYISELKRALVESGIYEDEADLETRKLTLKPAFKASGLYKNGWVFSNSRIPRDFTYVQSVADLGIGKTNFRYQLSSGSGSVSGAFMDEENPGLSGQPVKFKEILIQEIPAHILRYALSRNPFYHFGNLCRYFPNLVSIADFMVSKKYLGDLEITLMGTGTRLQEISHSDYLQALSGFLQDIETKIRSNITEFEGSGFRAQPIRQVFRDKEIRVRKGSTRSEGQETLLCKETWYAYNAHYGTMEEKKFIELFSRRFESLSKKFQDICLIRNEREIKIFDEAGRAFEPDFILFCTRREDLHLAYQVFIEPKGAHLIGYDQWKENFLNKMGTEKKTLTIHTDQYLITAVPFYNYGNENEFRKILDKTLAF